MDAAGFRQRLDESRAALLDALKEVSEREFAAEVEPGLTLIAALAALAPAEREAVRTARNLLGLPERALPPVAPGSSARVTPPQVVHDLAGARYDTALFLEAVESAVRTSPAMGQVTALIEAIEQRERAAAALVGGRLTPRGSLGA